MSILANLGLDKVEADPNKFPDGRYHGVVFEETVVIAKTKGTVSHVITYKVTHGEFANKQKQEWFKLGKDPVDANGQPTTDVKEMVSFTPDMSEEAKSWYKKRFVDLGFSEQEVNGDLDTSRVVGIPVTFGLKTKDTYQNINFVEKREATADETPVGLGNSAGTPAAVPTGLSAAPAAPATPPSSLTGQL